MKELACAAYRLQEGELVECGPHPTPALEAPRC